jgi:hypothetical protein
MNHASYSWDASNLVKGWNATAEAVANWWNNSADKAVASAARVATSGVKEAHAAEKTEEAKPPAQDPSESSYQGEGSLLKELYKMISTAEEVPTTHYMYRGWTEAR